MRIPVGKRRAVGRAATGRVRAGQPREPAVVAAGRRGGQVADRPAEQPRPGRGARTRCSGPSAPARSSRRRARPTAPPRTGSPVGARVARPGERQPAVGDVDGAGTTGGPGRAAATSAASLSAMQTTTWEAPGPRSGQSPTLHVQMSVPAGDRRDHRGAHAAVRESNCRPATVSMTRAARRAAPWVSQRCAVPNGSVRAPSSSGHCVRGGPAPRSTARPAVAARGRWPAARRAAGAAG